MYRLSILILTILATVAPWNLEALQGVSSYRATGKFALSVHAQGLRQISGHFSDLRGEVSIPTHQLHSHGRGEVLIRLNSWRGRDPSAAHPIEALSGPVKQHYAVLNIETVTGLTEAVMQAGTPQAGTLIGTLNFDGGMERVSVPVHVLKGSSDTVTIQALRPLYLSRQRLGLERSGRGQAENYDDTLRAFFRLTLTAVE